MNHFNTWLATKITGIVATMWCAYAFALLALVSLPAALSSHNVVIIVAWVAQTFLQLVLLSIILVGQKIQSDQQEHNHAEHMAHLSKIHKHLGIK